VAVQLDAQGDEVGIGFTLNFDPAVLSAPVVTAGADTGGATITSNSAEIVAGKLGILVDRPPLTQFAAGNKRIVTISFDVAPIPPAATPMSFGSDVAVTEVVDGTSAPLAASFNASSVSLLMPTAAGVSVSGRVLSVTGSGLRNARVTLTSPSGRLYSAQTNSFGAFRIENVPAGEVYTLNAMLKGMRFSSRTVSVTDEVTGLELFPDH
jgi:hypothetical protein